MLFVIIVAVIVTADTLRAQNILSFLKRRLLGRKIRIISFLIAIACLWYVVTNYLGPVVLAIVATTVAVYAWERRSDIKTFLGKLKNRAASSFNRVKGKMQIALDGK